MTTTPRRFVSLLKRKRTLSFFLLMGVVLLLVITFLLATSWRNTASASGGTLSNEVYGGYGSLNHPKGWCGNGNGQAPCPTPAPDWTLGTSDLTNTITSDSDYQSMQSRFGYTALDTPVIVHAYGAHTGKDYYDNDHLVVSVRNVAGMRCGIFDFVYDSTHTHIRFSSFGEITEQDPHSRLAFPYISAGQAKEVLHSQRHLDLLPGKQPELIFFPIDPRFPDPSSPVHSWAGGGNSALNPMWHLVGSDTHDYFVGTDLNTHDQKDLPITTTP